MPGGASPRTAQGKYPTWSSANSLALAGSSTVVIGKITPVDVGFKCDEFYAVQSHVLLLLLIFGPCLGPSVVFIFRKRDPIMMHSLIKYSVMELQKSIQHDIMEKLNEHTEAGAGVRPKVAFPQQNLRHGCWKSMYIPTLSPNHFEASEFLQERKYGGHLKKQWVQGF